MNHRLLLLTTIAMYCAAGRAGAQITTKTLPGFQGIAWGDSIKVAKSKMAALPGFKFSPTESQVYSQQDQAIELAYLGGTLGGENIGTLSLKFSDQGFASAMLIFEPEEHQVLQQYARIQSLLSRKYGEPDKQRRLFKEPYRDGDGDEETAIAVGKADISSFWDFPGGRDDARILLLTLSNLMVSMTYDNKRLSQRIADQAAKKNAAEF